MERGVSDMVDVGELVGLSQKPDFSLCSRGRSILPAGSFQCLHPPNGSEMGFGLGWLGSR